MITNSTLNPLDTIQAKIQARVAKFLSLKEIILRYINSSSITVRSKAMVLYNQQKNLEEQLPDVLNQIEILKQGAWTLSDIANIGLFYAALETQIKDVGKLVNMAEGKQVSDTPSTSPEKTTPLLKYLMIFGIGLTFMSAFRRR
jgi:hypothetical protein